MNSRVKNVLCVSLVLLAARCDAAESSPDENIAQWTERALTYARKVRYPYQRDSLAINVAVMLARQGKIEQALTEGRQLIDKQRQKELITSICPYLVVKEAIKLIETLPSQEERDAAYYDVGLLHAHDNHVELAVPFLERVSPDKAAQAWLVAAAIFCHKERFEVASDLFGKAVPRTDKDRELMERMKSDCEQHHRKHHQQRKRWEAARNQGKELDLAKREARNAEDGRDKVMAWLRVAAMQREFGWPEEFRDSMTDAEHAADEIEQRELRAFLLSSILDEYRRSDCTEQIHRMARKCLSAWRESIVGGYTGTPPVFRSAAPSRIVKLLIMLDDFEEAVRVARMDGEWYELGYRSAEKDAVTLAHLERHLSKLTSAADQANIALGVAAALQDKAATQTASHPD